MVTPTKNHIAGNEIIVYAAGAIYSKESILKCLYWYGDKFHATITMENDQYYRVSLVPTKAHPLDLGDMELYLQKLERDATFIFIMNH